MKGCLDTVSGLSAMKPFRTFHFFSHITCLHAYSLTQWVCLFSWVENHLKLCNFQPNVCAWPTEGQLRVTLQMFEELFPPSLSSSSVSYCSLQAHCPAYAEVSW